MAPGRSAALSDLRGVSKLVVAAVAGVTDIVEDMHRNIARLSPIVGRSAAGPAPGISGLVYKSVRGVTRAVGFGLDAALAQIAPLFGNVPPSPRRETALAVLNGVLGDRLAAAGNPLAITMCLRKDGQPLVLERRALAAAFAPAGGRLLVLVHGLCMNDLGWKREGHDHGAALARDLGYTALYLHYNSGRHISENGQEFAHLIERLCREWPVPVKELVIVSHSMGGLVARSACHYALLAGYGWLPRLNKLVFLATPHHGAPLERAGSWVDLLVGISPYTAPFSRLGGIRSAGVKDLRYGNLLDEDWKGREHGGDARTYVPLPGGVQCFAVAASRGEKPAGPGTRLRGDGLVPVRSALGLHRNAALALSIPASRQRVFHEMNHFDLLGRREVCERMALWLSRRGTARRARNKPSR